MNRVLRLRTKFAILALLATFAAGAKGQNDLRRSTIAITYPLDQTIEVGFHGTTRLPRLKGTAKVRRQGRRGEGGCHNRQHGGRLGVHRADDIAGCELCMRHDRG